jgi:hypothetical protein
MFSTVHLHRFSAAVFFILLQFLLLSNVLGADDPEFSGKVETNAQSFDSTYGGTDWILEQYANFRMDVDVNDSTTVYTAVNANAAATSRDELTTGAELERLYFLVRTDTADFYSGYMRIPFGYGQAFRPTDIFNPPNPLFPDARPKGALGALVALYPFGDWKIQLFGADRTNPYEVYDDYNRPIAGSSGEIHTSEISSQTLYAVQSPEQHESNLYHYFGQSFKFDLVAGFAIDTLYAYDSRGSLTTDELEFAFGADYSILDGDIYFLLQYFFNGDGILESDQNLDDLYGTDQWRDIPIEERYPIDGYSDFYRRHYIYFSTQYLYDDYTRFTNAIVFAPEDGSWQPALSAEHEPFQAMLLSLTLRFPLDPDVFGNGDPGELGAKHNGYNSSVSGKASLKF